MKKLWIWTLIICLLSIHGSAWAAPPEFSGGVNNEYLYEEMVFLTGEPIKFTGTFSVTETEKDGVKTVSYKFVLKPEDKTINAKLDRKTTYVTQYTNRNDKGQTIGQTRIDKYSEVLKYDKDTYTLVDYQFSKSDVIDNRPASDFYSGNYKGRKYYTVNKDQGEVIIEISGGNAGYENFWGKTETQLTDYVITSKRDITTPAQGGEPAETNAVSWQGTVTIQASDSQTKTLKYSDNEASFSSFNGGHIRITNQEVVSKYDYNLPVIHEGRVSRKTRNKGTVHLSQNMVPKLERLVVPKFRDVKGHWAEEYIEKLYSLDVFDEQSQIFAPDVAMNRLEYIKGVMKACNIRTSLVQEKPVKKPRNAPPEVSLFKDLSTDHVDYKFVKDAVEKRIIMGLDDSLFAPKDPLTRAQAITILIRALGFESKAPNPGYYTAFADDRQIPNWAKDSIYMAREIQLIEGDSFNRVNPNKVITRAEASAMLVRFLEFLEKDLQRDYRENIINFN